MHCTLGFEGLQFHIDCTDKRVTPQETTADMNMKIQSNKSDSYSK